MSDTTTTRLEELLKELHLPAIRAHYPEVTRTAIAESLSYEAYLSELLSIEHEDPVWSGSDDRVKAGIEIAQTTLTSLLVR